MFLAQFTTSPATRSHIMPNKASTILEPPDAIRLLIEDHNRVKRLFAAFEQLGSDAEADSKRELVELTCAELTIHAQIEEELVYPALRNVVQEQDLLDEAQVEHDVAKQLIAELDA